VVKQYAGRVVTGTLHRLVHSSTRLFLTMLWSTPGCEVLNKAYSERLNETFRERLAFLARRTRRLARRLAPVTEGMYLTGALHNFFTTHASLTLGDGRRQTPAMAADITRPSLDRQRAPALSRTAPFLGASSAARTSFQGTPILYRPVMPRLPFTIVLPDRINL
jgi:hypothetical protein